MTKSREKQALCDEREDSMTNVQAPLKGDEILVAAINVKIYAVRKKDGARIWKAEAPTGGGSSGIISLFITDEDKLIVGGGGRTACMNLFTGETIWLNKMPDCGYGEVGVIATTSRILPPRAQNALRTDDTLPPSYEESSSRHQQQQQSSPAVISCTAGKCVSIDMATGHQLWEFPCPKGGWYIPVALIEPVSAESHSSEQKVYVACGKWIYCLQARSGILEWSRPVSNMAQFFGSPVTLATAWSSRLAAETHSAYSQFPGSLVEES
ncbi:hypothetical protein BDB00DRAFT_807875 [Zychaea mexicana]|uniref:uncharacterized protein n=1 Tax=Zychaea mexicana TaxID=64656 RepID=UPI0022FE1A77|nr:uncharacterized protein BDB00DRAFT_807875 [Zychaea mexicana]KAI9496570.1 hypothetical protein BDB00DRAFT_807875 [Zychaea mexicana]